GAAHQRAPELDLRDVGILLALDPSGGNLRGLRHALERVLFPPLSGSRKMAHSTELLPKQTESRHAKTKRLGLRGVEEVGALSGTAGAGRSSTVRLYKLRNLFDIRGHAG